MQGRLKPNMLETCKVKIMEKLEPLKKKKHIGCLCCSSLGTELLMDTVLYMGFGGWTIMKDGEVFFEEDMHKEFEEQTTTLADIEEQAKNEPDADWRAVCFTPLRGETYQRQDGKWLLVEENMGFA